MDLRPFSHAIEGQEILLAGSANLIAGKFFAKFVIEVPEFQIADEVRRFVREFCVLLICRLAFVVWTFAWVLQLQRRGNDQHFVEATFFMSSHDDPPDSRIDRQAAEGPADRS